VYTHVLYLLFTNTFNTCIVIRVVFTDGRVIYKYIYIYCNRRGSLRKSDDPFIVRIHAAGRSAERRACDITSCRRGVRRGNTGRTCERQTRAPPHYNGETGNRKIVRRRPHITRSYENVPTAASGPRRFLPRARGGRVSEDNNIMYGFPRLLNASDDVLCIVHAHNTPCGSRNPSCPRVVVSVQYHRTLRINGAIPRFLIRRVSEIQAKSPQSETYTICYVCVCVMYTVRTRKAGANQKFHRASWIFFQSTEYKFFFFFKRFIINRVRV